MLEPTPARKPQFAEAIKNQFPRNYGNRNAIKI